MHWRAAPAPPVLMLQEAAQWVAPAAVASAREALPLRPHQQALWTRLFPAGRPAAPRAGAADSARLARQELAPKGRRCAMLPLPEAAAELWVMLRTSVPFASA